MKNSGIMELNLSIRLNEKLYLRNPEDSELGRKIILQGIRLINSLGFEAFTFKKLAIEIGTTEAGVYRYFENKHRLLLYLVDWYWGWQEYRIIFHTNNISSAEQKIKILMQVLSAMVADEVNTPYIDEKQLYQIVMSEGSKTIFTKQVEQDNQDKLFKPYKDLCQRIATIFLEYNPKYPYSHSLATTLIETAHSQKYYMQHLPSLTDFKREKTKNELYVFLEDMIFKSLAKN